MIRNAVIHISNEQPLVADLFALPTAGDAGLLCTNVRTLDGKRPVFIDRSDATFFFPYLHIRFIEMPDAADDGSGARAGEPGGSEAAGGRGAPGGWPDPEPGSLLPVPVGAPGRDDGGPGADDDLDLEIDEDFLRRVRDL